MHKKFMKNELNLNLHGTMFKFFLSDKGFDDGGYFWTDASISVKNAYLNYKTGPEILTFGDVQQICKSLAELLNGCITEKRFLAFLEPDLEITLNPKIDLKQDQKETLGNGEFDIVDVSAEVTIYLNDCVGQSYKVTLYREEIEILTNYLSERIQSLA